MMLNITADYEQLAQHAVAREAIVQRLGRSDKS